MWDEEADFPDNRVHEFAELAGVTVKALPHYDRIDLLKRRRNEDATAAENRRVLAERWLTLLEAEACGDAEMSACKQRAWSDQRNWPLAPRLKRSRELRLSLAGFDRVSEFIDKALAR